jgi:hypothetical protein
MQIKLVQRFIYTAGGILLAAALVRFLVAINAPFLPLRDPLLGIPTFWPVLIVGGMELAVALICLYGRQIGFQTGLLAWLVTNFLVYQIGLFWDGYPQKYGCLGSLTDPLHLSQGAIGFIMELIPVYLLLGSYAAFIWLWLTKEGKATQLVAAMSPDQRDLAAGLLKMPCPSCGIHIKFASQNLGQKTPCPHCQKTLTLRQPENLKISCFFCKEHIEFPAHAIGEKISCPHCKMDITLKEPA